jgi:hypothetical protein
MTATNPILSRAKLPDDIATVSYLGGLMESMNEQSSIRMEDLTLYPNCTNLQREPNAKMKIKNNNNTMFINEEKNRDPDAIGAKFGHLGDGRNI